MAKTKFVLNKSGVIDLLNSEGIKGALQAQAASVISRLDEGYDMKDVKSGDRVKVFVIAETEDAVQDNYENNSLLKALRG